MLLTAYGVRSILYCVAWQVEFHEEFEAEYDELGEEVQDELLAHLKLLEKFGPQLGRPHADTLKGSTFTNMKELRFSSKDGVWRSAFDPKRQAIVLSGGDKSGGGERRFYRDLIQKPTDGSLPPRSH